MSEEANIEKAPQGNDAPAVQMATAPAHRQPDALVAAEAGTPIADASKADPAVEGTTPKAKRRTRKTASAEEGSEAPSPRRRPRSTDAEQAGDAPVKRRTRKSRSVGQEGDAPEASDEVIQARALAQISQASVVRRQRRAAERAAEVLAVAEGPRSADHEPAPAPADADGKAELPLIDPALRPHRRGRKPKAYVEAEKAAAAALAAQQAALMAARDQQRAESVSAASEAADAKGGAESDPDAVERVDAGEAKRSAAKKDARPGRASRARKSARKEDAPNEPAGSEVPEAKPDEQGDSAAKVASDFDSNAAEKPDAKNAAKADDKPAGKQARRNHKDRREGDRPERGDAPSSKAAERRERRERQKENRKQRNNRFAPTEPSLTREELTAMKVAELREKARSLDLDPTGVKKADLVEMIYAAAARAEGFRDIEGILDIDNQGFGYIRAHGYMPSRDDAFVPAQMIRAAGLRPGDLVAGTLRPMRANDKLPGLGKLRSVNGLDPEQVKHRPKFSDLTPIYPNEPLKMEHGKDSITGRAIDIVSPIGKGQRGLIVSPPKAGKTTILKKICQSISINNPEVHLICLLVDERPEEVTDMQRSIKGDVVASTFDMPADNHTRVSELVIERAKRIVEMGGDVVVVLDSITRLARAYNLAAPASGRILSGGVDSAALYPPKRFLGAARNIENGGSLTILASALVDTGSKMDEVIFEEFKGTGNMELKLDRDLADRRIFPAIDPVASGTRNEDLLVDEQMRPFMWGIRRILAGLNNTERAAASFIKGLKGTNSNQDFLIRTAKKAADHPDAL